MSESTSAGICSHEGCGKTFPSEAELEKHKQQHLRRELDSGLLSCDKSPKLHGFTDQTPTPSKWFGDNLLKTPTIGGALMQNPFEEQFNKVWRAIVCSPAL